MKIHRLSFKIFVFILLTAFFFSLFSSGGVIFAQDSISTGNGGLVPCGFRGGPPCNTVCYFFALGQNIFNFFIFIAIALGALAFVIGGLLWTLTGFDQKMHDKGKEVILAAMWGIIIVFASWLIINTIINFFGNPAAFPTPWNELKCEIPPEETILPSPNATTTPLISGEGDLCTGTPSACGNSSCGQYAAMIARQASGIASANLLKSIMYNESACNVNAASSAGSYGLMQFQVGTAKNMASRCEVNPQIVNAEWLRSSDNAEATICMAAAYLNELAQAGCESNARHTIAGYNGGAKACKPSVDCAGTGCDESVRRQWECTSVPNNYEQTRVYVKRNLYCMQNPGF